MVKVSITLPNSAQITLESEEAEIIHEVVSMVLRDLPRDLMQAFPSPAADGSPLAVSEKSTSVEISTVAAVPSISPEQPHAPSPGQSEPGAPVGTSPPPSARRKATTATRPSPEQGASQQGTTPSLESSTQEQKDAFAEFCRSANPLGDMRRVVVAADGAHRFLSMESVDAEDLAELFDLASWRRPYNFTQTLRNAARDKFRWLERVPGRAGRYAATDLGRSVTLKE